MCYGISLSHENKAKADHASVEAEGELMIDGKGPEETSAVSMVPRESTLLVEGREEERARP